ncbi:hypothetical protein [Aliamphritea spongicola]|nr:hypothetical protein [Aliamphritea spongicola]
MKHFKTLAMASAIGMLTAVQVQAATEWNVSLWGKLPRIHRPR